MKERIEHAVCRQRTPEEEAAVRVSMLRRIDQMYHWRRAYGLRGI